MIKLPIFKYTRTIAIAFFIIIFFQSCKNQEKKSHTSFFKMESTKVEPIIDFNIIDCFKESNNKIIKLTNITFERSKDFKTLQLLSGIKKNQKEMDYSLKNLTKKNLIIIPKSIDKMNINIDSIKTKKGDLHLLRLLESEIDNQIILLDSISKSTKDIEFKIFSANSKKILESDNEKLKALNY